MSKQHYEEILPGARFWTGDMEVEPQALEQIRKVTRLPILAGHVAVMPDVHLGKGATVGTVIATRAAIVPAAVGMDIGCGVLAPRPISRRATCRTTSASCARRSSATFQ